MTSNEKLKVADLNAHLSCILCGGYYIDATSITVCLHSFCRACIVRYLESSRYCPVCEVQIHKTRPLRCIRPDKSLQDLVYKIIPGLFQNEMKRRRELYASQPPEALEHSHGEEDRGDITEDRYIFSSTEMFSISLKYRPKEQESSNCTARDETATEEEAVCRYLKCPAALKVYHLKKFLRCKYSISNKFLIIMEHCSEPLNDEYSLMDIGYIHNWKRKGPLNLTFRILDRTMIRLAMKQQLASPSPEPAEEQTNTEIKDEKQLNEHKESVEDSVPMDIDNDEKEVNVFKSDTKSDTESAEELECNSKTVSIDSKIVKESVEEEIGALLSPKKSDAIPIDESQINQKPLNPVVQSEFQDKISNDKELTEETANLNVSENPATIDACLIDDSEPPPLKVPKLMIPLTPKIIQQAAHHAKEDEIVIDVDLFEGRLVIAEPEDSPKSNDSNVTLIETKEVTGTTVSKGQHDDDELDSGRGSDVSSRNEAPSLNDDDELRSPVSITICSPDSEKSNQPTYPAPLPYPTNKRDSLLTGAVSVVPPLKDNFGALDLSMGSRNEVRPYSELRPKHVANPPPAIAKSKPQTMNYLSVPKHPSFKLLPAVLPHASIYKKPEYTRGNFRYNRGSTLKVFNPDPIGGRTKIVIKNVDPRTEENRHHHRRVL